MLPQSIEITANGLPYRVLEWPAHAATSTVLLIHGYMDAAASWDLVAGALSESGFRVIAPDLRGFGESGRVPSGGYYYFSDYIHDVADVVDALVPVGSPLFVVGHSMGGSVATMYTATFPERPTRLAVLEGAGPLDMPPEIGPQVMRRWVEQVRATKQREERSFATREEALQRLAANHPRVPEAVLRTRLEALASTDPGGRTRWKADPLHGTRSPVPFSAALWGGYARAVTCPVLWISGGPVGWHPPDEDARVAAFPRVQRAEIDDAGHMMHWTKPGELVRHLLPFFSVTTG